MGGWWRLWAEVLFLYIVWPLPACIFSLSVVILREMGNFLLSPFPDWNEALLHPRPLSYTELKRHIPESSVCLWFHLIGEQVLCCILRPHTPSLKHYFSYLNSLSKKCATTLDRVWLSCLPFKQLASATLTHSIFSLLLNTWLRQKFLPPQAFPHLSLLLYPCPKASHLPECLLLSSPIPVCSSSFNPEPTSYMNHVLTSLV